MSKPKINQTRKKKLKKYMYNDTSVNNWPSKIRKCVRPGL